MTMTTAQGFIAIAVKMITGILQNNENRCFDDCLKASKPRVTEKSLQYSIIGIECSGGCGEIKPQCKIYG